MHVHSADHKLEINRPWARSIALAATSIYIVAAASLDQALAL
jgi:hypothetical protein